MHFPNEDNRIGWGNNSGSQPRFAKEYIDAMEKFLKENKGYEEVKFITGYEAGCLGFSLYKELTKYGIACKIIAPTTLV
jgi:transposase